MKVVIVFLSFIFSNQVLAANFCQMGTKELQIVKASSTQSVCMDALTQVGQTHDAFRHCSSQKRRLCSVAELIAAKHSGQFRFPGYEWTADEFDSVRRIAFDGLTKTSTGTVDVFGFNSDLSFRCCYDN